MKTLLTPGYMFGPVIVVW